MKWITYSPILSNRKAVHSTRSDGPQTGTISAKGAFPNHPLDESIPSWFAPLFDMHVRYRPYTKLTGFSATPTKKCKGRARAFG